MNLKLSAPAEGLVYLLCNLGRQAMVFLQCSLCVGGNIATPALKPPITDWPETLVDRFRLQVVRRLHDPSRNFICYTSMDGRKTFPSRLYSILDQECSRLACADHLFDCGRNVWLRTIEEPGKQLLAYLQRPPGSAILRRGLIRYRVHSPPCRYLMAKCRRTAGCCAPRHNLIQGNERADLAFEGCNSSHRDRLL